MASKAFERIAEDIRGHIMSGDLKPGDKVPSGNELREQYGVSIGPVNRATQLLLSWGLIETRVGSGTYVVDAPPRAPLVGPGEHSDRLLRGEPIYAAGERAEVYEASLLTTDMVSDDVVSAVGLPVPSRELAGEATTIIKRARKMFDAQDRPTGICCSWYNHPLIAQQGRRGGEVIERLTSTERIPGGTTHVLAELFDRELTHVTTRAGVRFLPVQLARELGKDPGTPVLWLLETRHADEYVLDVDEWFRVSDVVIR